MKKEFVTYIRTLQNTITSALEEVDGKAKFKEDVWKRPEGGGGRSRVIENGTVFEKGGVNISEVHGTLPESMQQYFGVNDANFFARTVEMNGICVKQIIRRKILPATKPLIDNGSVGIIQLKISPVGVNRRDHGIFWM